MPTVVQGTARQPPGDYFDELIEGAIPVLAAMNGTEDHEEKQRIADEEHHEREHAIHAAQANVFVTRSLRMKFVILSLRIA